MATRTAGSGILYALIFFVFLFVFSIALAIVMYTQRIAVEEQLGAYTQVSRDFVSDTEQRSDRFRDTLQASGDATVFGHLNTQIDTLQRRLTGTTGSMEAIERQLTAAGITGGLNAVGLLNNLRGEVATLKEEVATKEAALATANKGLEDIKGDLNQLRTASDRQLQDLKAQVDRRATEWRQFETKSNEERAQVAALLEQARNQGTAAVREKEAEIRQLESEIARLRGRITELSAILRRSRLSAPDVTLEPDGRVIQVDAGNNVAYINLGRDDRLILGMTFEVFDAATGIQTEVDRGGQIAQVGGKGTLEVIRFSESGRTAVCRIVRQSFGRPIVTGDLISNIVYDKHRTYRFFVFGDFDLNNDGIATPGERQRVINLIRQWGGEVIEADEMPVDTDFLVLGRNIEFPMAPADDPPPTPEIIERYLAERRLFTQYQELSGLARELSIPVLNQNRFLSLIGYYRN